MAADVFLLMKLHGKSLSDEEVLDISLREENMLRLRSHTALCLLGESEGNQITSDQKINMIATIRVTSI